MPLRLFDDPSSIFAAMAAASPANQHIWTAVVTLAPISCERRRQTPEDGSNNAWWLKRFLWW